MDGKIPPQRDGQDFAAPVADQHMGLATRQPGGLAGKRLGDYHLQELLGFGGMADVYRAYDLVLLREVAVKVLSESLADDADFVNRFRTEARRVAALRHPHLVPVYHAGEDQVDGRRLLYLVMPLMHESLEHALKREGKLPHAEAVRLMLQVADGLEAAHRFGLVHRDVKPGNILLDADGQAVLADFGLAREVKYTVREATRQPWGTPEYMAPEQLHGGGVDQRADIYAMGVVLYEMLTGKRPFEGESSYDIAAKALHDPLIPPSAYDPAIPPALERVTLTALAREPDGRYASAAEFARALRQAIGQQSVRAVTFAPAVTVPLPDHFWSSPHISTHISTSGSRRGLRWLLGFMLAAGVAIASLGGALTILQHNGQGARNIASSLGNSPLAQTTPTSASSLPLDQTPAPATTPQATNTPGAAPRATATSKPTAALTIAPLPLDLTPDPNNVKNCIATQTITNNTGSTVGWWWQGPTVSGFHFVIDNKPSVGWPNKTTNAPPGGKNTMVVTAPCKYKDGDLAPEDYNITVTDSLGDTYTFVMRLE